MKLPYLVKAKYPIVKLGFNSEPTKEDCRVLSEFNYQFIVNLLKDIRTNDITKILEGKEMLPEDIRERIQELLNAHEQPIL